MSKTMQAMLAQHVDRRRTLTGLGAGLALANLPAFIRPASAAPLKELVLFGPPAGPSIVLAQAVASNALSGVADKASLKIWRSPDEMRAGLTSGTMSAVVLPVQVAGNLYNRGMKLKLLNIMTKGLIYIVSTDAGITDIKGLKGRKLAVPFRNDMPDLVIKRLLSAYEMLPDKDITLESTGSPIEAMQMLVAGKVDAVLAPEPAVSAAIMLGKAAGKDIKRVIDVQEVWGEVSGKGLVLPQAGLALTDSLTAENPELADALQNALADVAAGVNADPAGAAKVAAASLDFPEPVIAASIATSKLVAVRASEARGSIEAMLETLAASDAGIIGGKLPDDGFYL